VSYRRSADAVIRFLFLLEGGLAGELRPAWFVLREHAEDRLLSLYLRVFFSGGPSFHKLEPQLYFK
jgi:hypothetical protein